MAEKSKIAWTESTFNPWLGCTKVSPGCQHCYAETLAARYKWPVWGPTAARRITSAGYWRQPLRWNKLAGEAGAFWPVFCGSLCDVFENRTELGPTQLNLWDLIEATPNLTWLLLTKRPENIRPVLAHRWSLKWPDHVWIGTSVEDQQRAEKRIPFLLQIPARVRFLSIEPMLGPVDLLSVVSRPEVNRLDCRLPGELHFDWVICGGESGKEHRPFDLGWARDLRDQCRIGLVAFFMKQLGGYPDKRHELEDLPADLQIREWPHV